MLLMMMAFRLGLSSDRHDDLLMGRMIGASRASMPAVGPSFVPMRRFDRVIASESPFILMRGFA
jgi:hypothetical protein